MPAGPTQPPAPTRPAAGAHADTREDDAARAYHHGDLRRALLERAAEVIERDGIEALTLRGLARDLGVSHGAPNRHFRNKEDLLSTLARHGYEALTSATLAAADGLADPCVRLNHMGRGFLRWALAHRALFATVNHPDVARFRDAALEAALDDFRATIRAAVVAAQGAGRHGDVPSDLLTLYTNAVPFGAAMLLQHGADWGDLEVEERETRIAALIELVVPIADRV